jgi:hypothetical protein
MSVIVQTQLKHCLTGYNASKIHTYIYIYILGSSNVLAETEETDVDRSQAGGIWSMPVVLKEVAL